MLRRSLFSLILSSLVSLSLVFLSLPFFLYNRVNRATMFFSSSHVLLCWQTSVCCFLLFSFACVWLEVDVFLDVKVAEKNEARLQSSPQFLLPFLSEDSRWTSLCRWRVDERKKRARRHWSSTGNPNKKSRQLDCQPTLSAKCESFDKITLRCLD